MRKCASSVSDPNATTQPDRDITLADIWDVLGSLVIRVGHLADAVEHLTDKVADLAEKDRHFERRVRSITPMPWHGSAEE